MNCPNCQTENKEGRRFCGKCGTKLGWKCSACGFDNEPNDAFCGGCGEKQSAGESADPPKLEDIQDRLSVPEPLRQQMESAAQEMVGENRLVTVLFADISGFTSLSESFPTETVVEKVNQCFRVVTDAVYRYEGSVNRFIGDCVLAFFGALIAHENDPERAVRAALEMRNAVYEMGLEISVGVNTGMMYFGPIGTEQHQEVSAYGPDINLAKRLQEAAKPGQILVGAGIHRLTHKMFDFDQQETLELKGLYEPVTAYEVLRLSDRPEKLRGIEGLRSRMIGREREFSDLKAAVDRWHSGQGQIVSVIGEAGIGKSRLVSELKTYVDGKAKNLWQEGRCVSIGQSISYWPFLDMLRSYFGLSNQDDEAEIARKVTRGTTALFDQDAEEYLPFLGRLLSFRFNNELDRQLDYAAPEQIRNQTLMRLRDGFETLARRNPLLLIIEDLHWADDLSLDLITLLMESLSTKPLMLLCVYRPEREHRCWQLAAQADRKCRDRYTEITLKHLSTKESRELVGALLTIENLPESVRDIILQKSEGNPFFIEEVIRSLIDRDLVYRESDRWRARDDVSSLDVPDTIQGVVLARVDRLDAEAREVLQCASVIGRLFKYRLLEQLAGSDRHLDRHLLEFQEKDLVYEERTVPELEYAFKHTFTQEATYQSILERRRQSFHHQVGEGMERLYPDRLEDYYEELAHHYSLSDDTEKAVEYLYKAGEKAARGSANEAAIIFFQKGLECLEALPDTPERRHLELNFQMALSPQLIATKGWGSKEVERACTRALALSHQVEVTPRLFPCCGHLLLFIIRKVTSDGP